jgi:hypothetical protein
MGHPVACPKLQAFLNELITEAEQEKRDGTLKVVGDTW